MLSMPSFAALGSFVLVSRATWSVFNTFKRSILQAVGHAQVGPALPQALQLVRHSDKGLVIREKDMLEKVITPAEARALTDVSAVAWELEDLFSWRYPISASIFYGALKLLTTGIKIAAPQLACSQQRSLTVFIVLYIASGLLSKCLEDSAVSLT
jgi:hypothetical protein